MLASRTAVLTLVLLAATAIFSTASISKNYGEKSSQAAPAKFDGTYYTILEEGVVGGVVTFHSDGTVSSLVADMFSNDPAGQRQGSRSTPSQGLWRKVGNNEIKITTTFFFTEQFGDNYNPGGFVVNVQYLAVFDDPIKGVSPGYTSYNGVAELFLPNQNPNTDTPVLVVPLTDSTAYRMAPAK